MRFGIIANAGDPRTLADLAAEAESAGWDGVFYYDAIAIGSGELYDPWLSSRRWRCARSVSGSTPRASSVSSGLARVSSQSGQRRTAARAMRGDAFGLQRLHSQGAQTPNRSR